MTTPTTSNHHTVRLFRVVVATTAVSAVAVGVPALLWWAAGGGALPDPGPGGWTEIRSALAVGQVPDAAVLTAAVITGWAIWAYLIVVTTAEVLIGWRERHTRTDRDLTGPRRVIARGVTWTLATHSLATTLLTYPTLPSATPTPIAATIDEPATDPAGDRAPEPPPVDPLDTEAYIDYTSDQQAEPEPEPEPAPSAPAAEPEQAVDEPFPVVVEDGDTLWAIAEEHTGDPENYPVLWAATDHADQTPPLDPANPDLIYSGSTINIPTDLLLPTLDPPSATENPAAGTGTTTTRGTGPATPPPAEVDPEPSTTGTDPSTATSSQSTTPPPPTTGTTTRPDTTTRVEPSPGPSSTFGSDAVDPPGPGGDRGAAVALVALVGVGAAGAGIVLAGARRRRLAAMAAARDGQRPPRRSPSVERTERRLRARADTGPERWPVPDLQAGWDSLLPDDAGVSQPWVIRWNSDTGNLECAWTEDPDDPADTGRAPAIPGPGSPWELTSRTDRSGTTRQIWTLSPDQVPARPPRSVLPAMVSCADGTDDRPTGEGFHLNLEAAGIISVDSTDPDLDTAGIARALLAQLHATGEVDVHLLDTDLGLDPPPAAVHHDPLDLEALIVDRLTRNQAVWDLAPSMFALRSGDHYHGPVTVVVGPTDQLQSCSHLLSLAQAPNIPLVVISLGRLSTAWATLGIQAPPDRDVITIHHVGAVLTVDHVSWASPTDAADIADLLADAATPWTADPDHVHPTLHHEPPADGSDEPPPPGQGGEAPRPDRPGEPEPPPAGDAVPEPVPQPEPFDEPPPATDPPLPAVGAARPEGLTASDWQVARRPRGVRVLLHRSEQTATQAAATALSPDNTCEASPGGSTGRVTPTDERPTPQDDTTGEPAAPVPASLTVGSDPAPPSQLDPDARWLPPAGQVARRVGSSGLRLEVCGPIRLRRAGSDGDLTDVPHGRNGLTAGQLSLLAYLGLATAHRGGVEPATATREIWPDSYNDGTYRNVHPDTLKKRIWELRKALKPLTATSDPKDVLPDATDHRYHLTNITCDWTQLIGALRCAEASAPGHEQFGQAVGVILALVRPPGLLTPPPARRGVYTWLDHYQPLVDDITRRIEVILAAHADDLTSNGDPTRALQVLATAQGIAPTSGRPVATATVRAHLANSDSASAEAAVNAYEAQLGRALAQRERTNPDPGSPRTILQNHTE